MERTAKARKIYEQIWKRHDRNNRFIFYPPGDMKFILMLSLYYSRQTHSVIRELYKLIQKYRNKAPRKSVELISGKKVKKRVLLNITDLNEPSRVAETDIAPFDSYKSTFFLVCMSLGFRVMGKQLSLIQPNNTGSKYFLALCLDAVAEHRQIISQTAPIGYGDIDYMTPRKYDDVYSDSQYESYVNQVFAHVISSAAHYSFLVLEHASSLGLITQSPLFFSMMMAHEMRRKEQIVEAVNAAQEVQEIVDKAEDKVCFDKLEEARKDIEQLSEQNEKLREELKEAYSKINAIAPNVEDKEESEQLTQIAEKAKSVVEQEEAAPKVETGSFLTDVVKAAQERERRRELGQLAESQGVDTKDAKTSSELSDLLKDSLALRRAEILQEEEEEEEGNGGDNDFFAQSKIGNNIYHRSSNLYFTPDSEEAGITKKPETKDNSRSNVLSPTRENFSDVYQYL